MFSVTVLIYTGNLYQIKRKKQLIYTRITYVEKHVAVTVVFK